MQIIIPGWNSTQTQFDLGFEKRFRINRTAIGFENLKNIFIKSSRIAVKTHNNRIHKSEITLPKIVVCILTPMVEIPEHEMPEMVWINTCTTATR